MLFIKYWEARRESERKLLYQLATGIPVGLLFALPIAIILFSSRYWYKRADMVANSSMSPSVLILAMLMIAGFIAIIYKRVQWDKKEQQYLELLSKEKHEKADQH